MLPWPGPALLSWAGAWCLHALGLHQGWGATASLASASALGVALSLLGGSWWRRLLIGLGFPLALLLSGAASLPAWSWLLPLALLLLIYPLNAWRDAPLFPTPTRALLLLPQRAPLPDGALVLDAGCGLGAGLRALRLVYPLAALHGVERSALLWLLCRARCPWARVRRGDMWLGSWAPYALVYLFQRPESMDRASDKALAELQRGAWLVSLDFEAVSLVPQARLLTPDGRILWLYQAPLQRQQQSGPGHTL